MEFNINNSISEFDKYVKQYDMSNNMILKKYYHTFRVVDYAKELAQSENLNKHDTYLAIICALLHDIARFKQATEFNTFLDLKSFDHGDVGYDILMQNDYLSNYIKNDVDKTIVLQAVKNHNKFSIDPNLNERAMFFCKLVRDADKLDILDKQKNEITDNIHNINEKVIETVKKHMLYMNDGIKRNDASEIVKKLCMIFDLNFKKSFEIIVNRKILERKMDVLKKFVDENQIEILTENLESFVYSKLK